MSSVTPWFLKIPARWPSSTTEVSHRPRWPTAIRNVSSADAGKISHSTAVNAQNSSRMDPPSSIAIPYAQEALLSLPERLSQVVKNTEHHPIPPHSIKLSAFQRKFFPGI